MLIIRTIARDLIEENFIQLISKCKFDLYWLRTNEDNGENDHNDDHNDKNNEEDDNTDTGDDNNDENGESRKSTMVCRHARTKMLKYTAA